MNNDDPASNQVPVNAPPPAPFPTAAPPQPASTPLQGTPAPAQQPVYPAQENPGQMLGIVSIILSFVGFSLIGAILGGISRSQSKKSGAPTTLGTIGLILGIVFTVLTVLVGIVIIMLSMAAANDPEFQRQNSTYSSTVTSNEHSTIASPDTSNTAKLASDARSTAVKLEAYRAKTGDYPKSSHDLAQYAETQLDPSIDIFSTSLLTNSSLTYIYCGTGSAQIVYLGTSKEDKHITPLGSASSTEVCPKHI